MRAAAEPLNDVLAGLLDRGSALEIYSVIKATKLNLNSHPVKQLGRKSGDQVIL